MHRRNVVLARCLHASRTIVCSARHQAQITGTSPTPAPEPADARHSGGLYVRKRTLSRHCPRTKARSRHEGKRRADGLSDHQHARSAPRKNPRHHRQQFRAPSRRQAEGDEVQADRTRTGARRARLGIWHQIPRTETEVGRPGAFRSPAHPLHREYPPARLAHDRFAQFPTQPGGKRGASR